MSRIIRISGYTSRRMAQASTLFRSTSSVVVTSVLRPCDSSVLGASFSCSPSRTGNNHATREKPVIPHRIRIVCSRGNSVELRHLFGPRSITTFAPGYRYHAHSRRPSTRCRGQWLRRCSKACSSVKCGFDSRGNRGWLLLAARLGYPWVWHGEGAENRTGDG